MKKRKQKWTVAAESAGFVLLVICLFVLYKYKIPTNQKMSAEDYYGSLQEDEAIVIAGEEIEEEHACLVDERLYLPYSVVENKLNGRFYWDESEQCMLFTTPLEIYEIPPESVSYSVDGTKQEAGAVILHKEGEEMYLDLEFVQEHSDFSSEYFEEPSRLVITYGDVVVKTASMKRKGAVRFQGGIKSPVLTQLEKGETVTVLEEMDHWSRVRTRDGYLGYVVNEKLSEVQETELPSLYTGQPYTSLLMEEKVNLVWHQINYPEMNANLEEDIQNVSGVNVISPTWYFLADSEGAIDSFADQDYITKAKEKGLQVWVLISNFSESVDTSALLASRKARVRVQEYLIGQAMTLGFEGINIDFEGIAESAGRDYVQFMRELSILCRRNGLILSVDVPVPMSFSQYYNRKELGVVCDYVIMMGYDEHYAGSDLTGSVASLEFERTGLANMKQEVAPEKIISAIPFYSRIWYTKAAEDGSSVVTSKAVGMKEGWDIVEAAGVEAVWDEETSQPYAEWTDEEGSFCQIWLEDDTTVAERAQLVSEYGVGGIAAWVLKMEQDYVWKIITEQIR